MLHLDVAPALPVSPEHGIGLIGCGGIANHGHLPAYRKAGWRVVALANRSEQPLRDTQAKWGIAAGFTDWRRLLDLPEVEVVDVTYPFDEERLAIVREAAVRGKHLLMQKPLAHSMEAAREMVAAAERAGVRLAVNQNARWCPQYRAVRAAIEQGLLGEVHLLVHEMQNNQDSSEWFTSRWYAKQQRFVIQEYSIHHLDLMRFWAGREPTEVKAVIARKANQASAGDMTACVQLAFPGRAIGVVLDNNAAYPQSPIYSRFRVEGTLGMIEGYGMGPGGVCLRSDRLPAGEHRPELPGAWFPDGFIGTMGELLCSIEQHRAPTISAQDNLKTLELVFRAYADARE